MATFPQVLTTFFGERLLAQEPLARYTSARIGGTAEWYLAVESADELAAAICSARQDNLPFWLMGAASNVLISENGVSGLTLHNRAKAIRFETPADQLLAIAESGAYLPTLARQCALLGWGGLEWAATVPGTVGGAVAGNAGAHGSDIAANLHSVRLLTPQDEIVEWEASDLQLGYRTSFLKHSPAPYYLLSATFALTRGDSTELQARIAHYQEYRKRTQPPGASMGSMFKNPPGDYAGRLLESCGLKGYRIGDAQISTVHANFFLNLGNATASEIVALIRHARSLVYAQTGVALTLEVVLVGADIAPYQEFNVEKA